MGLLKLCIYKTLKIPYCLITIDSKNISLSEIGSYLVQLYKIAGLSHLGYKTEDSWSGQRFAIYSKYINPKNIQYFKDRCPDLIRQEIKKVIVHYPHYIHEDSDGFKEVIAGNVPKELLKGDQK